MKKIGITALKLIVVLALVLQFPSLTLAGLVLYTSRKWYLARKDSDGPKFQVPRFLIPIALLAVFSLIGSGGQESATTKTSPTQLVQQVSSEKEESSSSNSTANQSSKESSDKDKLERKILTVISAVEKEPSREKISEVEKLLKEIKKPSTAILEKVQKAEKKVATEEKNRTLAEEAIKAAEADPTQDSLKKAKKHVMALVIPITDFSQKITQIETIVQEKTAQAEAEKVAAEQAAAAQAEADKVAVEQAAAAQVEADRVAAEQAAAAQVEADRVAAEQAAAAEAERVAAEQAEANRIAAEQAAVAQAEADRVAAEQAAAVEPIGQLVYIAPHSGSKYHYHPNCRGLSKAISVIDISLSDAQAQGYTLCGYED